MPPSPELSVIIPTYNERESLERLQPELLASLAGLPSEIVVVDDASPDGSAAWARAASRSDLPFVVIERDAKRGLASAVLEGFRHARGRWLAVMDADGSHPPSALPALVAPLREERAEFVLGSRRLPGGSAAGLGAPRRGISRIAAWIARPLTSVTDPMSGFFAVPRTVIARAALNPIGFKIGLEILVKCRPEPVVEVPYGFRPRFAGKSKLGSGEVRDYLLHTVRLYRWRIGAPSRASRTR